MSKYFYLYFFVCLGINVVVFTQAPTVQITNIAEQLNQSISNHNTNIVDMSDNTDTGSDTSSLIDQRVNSLSKKTEEYFSDELLNNEVSLVLAEFQDIIRLYNTKPSNIELRVQLYQRLLVRLNKMTVNTSFLAGQRDLMKSALRYRLGIKHRAEEDLVQLIQDTSSFEIRRSAWLLLVSFLFVDGNMKKADYLIKKYESLVDEDTVSYIYVIKKAADKKISEDEASYLLESVIVSPHTSFQQDHFAINLLNSVQEQLTTEDISKYVDFTLYNGNNTLALALMRIQIKKQSVEYTKLLDWEKNLGSYGKDLYETLRIYQNRSEDYKKFVINYQKKINAKGRGRIFHRRLYSYRGMQKFPYNESKAETILQEYLNGAVECEYAEKNAERVFRNFLAFKNYEKIVSYSQELRSKLSDDFVSPYINFWESYSLMMLGNTNDAVPLLGGIITVAPESYYGILAQQKLKFIFKKSPSSVNKYIASLKEKNTLGRKQQLDYAHILYFLGNHNSKLQAEKMFVQTGKIFVDIKSKVSQDKNDLIQAYLILGMKQDARKAVYVDGIKSIYKQDVLIADYYKNINNGAANIMTLVAKRSAVLRSKSSYLIGKEALRVYFPTPYHSYVTNIIKESKKDMDPYLLYSIMRTESFYKEKAKSHAGARGLMQIMPVTGKWLISKYMPQVQDYSLYTPEINIYLGSVYLYSNIDNMGFLPAIAAYNSGPTFVRKLSQQYEPKTDLELVEIHPKLETRDYVKKVVESYKRYSFIYNNNTQTIYELIS